MPSITLIGRQVVSERKKLRLNQKELAHRANISRATLEALENGRTGELGFSKITRILTILGLELKLQIAISARPTLDDLIEENRLDQGLGRPR